MIKANELRIGNIIAFDDGSTDIIKVDWLYKSIDLNMWFVQWEKISGNGKFRYGNSILEDFKPIPLTIEILERCGFKKYDIGETDDEDAWILPVDPSNENNYLSKFTLSKTMEYSLDFKDPIKIKSLHQLQNLYFTLTGEEISYNELAKI